MSQPSCDACSNLREYNAQFIMNGVSDSVAESLQNNTGFNACLDELHTDCEDLNDANDCLLGHMDDDVDNFEVCDWKDFMHNLLPNLYEVVKAIIATTCGLWTSIEDLKKSTCNTIMSLYGIDVNDADIIVKAEWVDRTHIIKGYPYVRFRPMKNSVCGENIYILAIQVANPGDDPEADPSTYTYWGECADITPGLQFAYWTRSYLKEKTDGLIDDKMFNTLWGNNYGLGFSGDDVYKYTGSAGGSQILFNVANNTHIDGQNAPDKTGIAGADKDKWWVETGGVIGNTTTGAFHGGTGTWKYVLVDDRPDIYAKLK